MRSERAISTVVDVALALLFISAAVLVLTVYLDDDSSGPEPEVADQTAETLAGTTITTEYSLADSDAVDDGEYSNETLTRVAHGPTAGLLGDAALGTVRFDDEPLVDYGTDFETALDDTISQRFSGAHEHFQFIAVWHPYEHSAIEGEAIAGRTPPADADISSVSMTVPSGMDSVETEATLAYADLEAWTRGTTYDDGDRVYNGGTAYEAQTDTRNPPATSDEWQSLGPYDPSSTGLEGVSHVVAETIVDEYLPPDESNHSLEADSAERALTVDRYERLAAIVDVDGSAADDFEDALNQTTADAATANDLLADDLATWIVDEDDAGLDALEAELDGIDDDDYEALEVAFDDALSTGEVTIVVRTWEP